VGYPHPPGGVRDHHGTGLLGDCALLLVQARACGRGLSGNSDAETLAEPERARAFVQAFQVSRNTYWNGIVRRILADLYDVTVTDPESVLAASRQIGERREETGWAESVLERLNVRTVVTGWHEPNDLGSIGHLLHTVPVYNGLAEALEAVPAARDQRAAFEEWSRKFEEDLDVFRREGVGSIRVNPYPLQDIRGENTPVGKLGSSRADPQIITRHLGHALLRLLDERGFHVQFFIGMRRGGRTGSPEKHRACRGYAHRHSRQCLGLPSSW
jgi:hypothetical protein